MCVPDWHRFYPDVRCNIDAKELIFHGIISKSQSAPEVHLSAIMQNPEGCLTSFTHKVIFGVATLAYKVLTDGV